MLMLLLVSISSLLIFSFSILIWGKGYKLGPLHVCIITQLHIISLLVLAAQTVSLHICVLLHIRFLHYCPIFVLESNYCFDSTSCFEESQIGSSFEYIIRKFWSIKGWLRTELLAMLESGVNGPVLGL